MDCFFCTTADVGFGRVVGEYLIWEVEVTMNFYFQGTRWEAFGKWIIFLGFSEENWHLEATKGSLGLVDCKFR